MFTCYSGNFHRLLIITLPNIGAYNKRAAGMQHTPPQDIFNAKRIILKLDLLMQSLKKFGKEMPKIESEKPIYNVNQGP